MTPVATGVRKHQQCRDVSFCFLMVLSWCSCRFFLLSTKTTKFTSNLRIRQLTPCFFLSDKDVFGCLWSVALHLSSGFWLCTAYSCSVSHCDHTTGVTKQEQKWVMTLQPDGVLRGAPQPGTLHVCRSPLSHKLIYSHTAGLWKRAGKEDGWVR